MNFSRAHTTTTYMMVMAALAAVLAPGQLAIAPLALVGLVASWFWQATSVRAGRWLTVPLIGYFLYSVVLVFAGAEILLTGASFLTLLTVAKLFQRRNARDYLQISVLSFLMMVAGTVLNAELGYGVLFLIYVIATTWALILLHFRREIENEWVMVADDFTAPPLAHALKSTTLVNARFFAATALVSLTVFAFSSLLFVVIPRVGFGAFFNKSRASVAMAGFSDGVRLGGHGVIKKDATIVMRAKVDDVYAGKKAPSIHWRGVAFDEYRRGEWRRSRSAPPTDRRVTHTGDITSHHVMYDGKRSTIERLLKESKNGVRQDIYLEPLGYDVLFGASMPLRFSFETRWRAKARAGQNDEIRYPHSAGIKYTVFSTLAQGNEAAMRRARGTIPDAYAPYLSLPNEVPMRIGDLAKEVAKNATNPYDKALALETFLRNRFDYTLELQAPPDGQDPVDFFLFNRKRGHCEYFSSAMALMARSIGLPSRNVNGFLGGEWNEYDNYIAVRSGDAHSWVEIYIAGHGWVTFDPTPSAEIDRLGRGGDGLWSRFSRMIDTLKFKWFQWVIEYDLRRQLRVFKKIGNFFKSKKKSKRDEKKADQKNWVTRNAKVIGASIGALAFLFFLAMVWRSRGRDRPGGRRERRSGVARIYLGTLRLLARNGIARPHDQTPLEFARAMHEAQIPGARKLAELTDLYYQHEYRIGTTKNQETHLRRATELKNAIRHALKSRR